MFSQKANANRAGARTSVRSEVGSRKSHGILQLAAVMRMFLRENPGRHSEGARTSVRRSVACKRAWEYSARLCQAVILRDKSRAPFGRSPDFSPQERRMQKGLWNIQRDFTRLPFLRDKSRAFRKRQKNWRSPRSDRILRVPGLEVPKPATLSFGAAGPSTSPPATDSTPSG